MQQEELKSLLSEQRFLTESRIQSAIYPLLKSRLGLLNGQAAENMVFPSPRKEIEDSGQARQWCN